MPKSDTLKRTATKVYDWLFLLVTMAVCFWFFSLLLAEAKRPNEEIVFRVFGRGVTIWHLFAIAPLLGSFAIVAACFRPRRERQDSIFRFCLFILRDELSELAGRAKALTPQFEAQGALRSVEYNGGFPMASRREPRRGQVSLREVSKKLDLNSKPNLATGPNPDHFENSNQFKAMQSDSNQNSDPTQGNICHSRLKTSLFVTLVIFCKNSAWSAVFRGKKPLRLFALHTGYWSLITGNCSPPWPLYLRGEKQDIRSSGPIRG